MRQRQETQDKLVQTLRQYGVWLLAALVLLPLQLVIGMVGIAAVYIGVVRLRPRGQGRVPTG